MLRLATASLVVLLLACPSEGGDAPSSTSTSGDDDSTSAATIDPTPATPSGDSSTSTSASTDAMTTTTDTTDDTTNTSESGSVTGSTGDTSSSGEPSTTSGGPVCGDGDQDGDESCDEDDLAGYTCVSLGPNFTGGALACDDACDFDTSACTTCGDGIAEGAEACDGEDLGGLDCTDLGMGFTGGVLGCDDACDVDTSACTDDDPVDYAIGFCRLQFPDAVETNTGAQIDVFGRVYIEGLTDLSDTNDVAANVSGWVGVGPDGSDPMIDAGWTWTLGMANASYGPASPGAEPNNDEYQAVLTAPRPGSYDFAFRFSGDGGDTFMYCDGQPAGNSDGYQPDNAGQLTTEA